MLSLLHRFLEFTTNSLKSSLSLTRKPKLSSQRTSGTCTYNTPPLDPELLDEIKTFFPSYLTHEDKAQLFQELANFPDNFNYYLFKSRPDEFLQGDGWKGFSIVDPDTLSPKIVSGIVLSNSCDIAVENSSDRRRKIVFCPIVSLARYKALLLRHKDTTAVESIMDAIRAQKITYLFYLPPGGALEDECIVFLDDVHSIFLDRFTGAKPVKTFALSQYGFYLLLLKISIHFTRFQEGVRRFDGDIAG